jgi:hypothetical protein
MNLLARWLDEHPEYPEVYVRLVDALREYIRNCDVLGQELLREEAITKERFDEVEKEMLPYRTMLADLEAHQIDPSLCGLKKRRP